MTNDYNLTNFSDFLHPDLMNAYVVKSYEP